MSGKSYCAKHAYCSYPENTQADLDRKFRDLIAIIPVWRQMELLSMEKEAQEIALKVNTSISNNHWNLKGENNA